MPRSTKEDDAGPDHCAGHSDLSQLEGYCEVMTHDASADLYQLHLRAGKRPVGYGLRQFEAAQKGGRVIVLSAKAEYNFKRMSVWVKTYKPFSTEGSAPH